MFLLNLACFLPILFMYPNGWKSYMQLNYINLTFMPKHFLECSIIAFWLYCTLFQRIFWFWHKWGKWTCIKKVNQSILILTLMWIKTFRASKRYPKASIESVLGRYGCVALLRLMGFWMECFGDWWDLIYFANIPAWHKCEEKCVMHIWRKARSRETGSRTQVRAAACELLTGKIGVTK